MTATHPAVGPAAPTARHDAWRTAFDVLAEEGVRTVFGLPDDDMRSMTAIEDTGVRLCPVVRQSAAVHMAAGRAALGAEVGVCVIGRGPAVAAAVPGLLEAWESRRPVLVLASGTAEARRGSGAFQDAPTLDMVRPVTKSAVRVTDAGRVRDALRAALLAARTAPAGPVYVELPDPDPEHAPDGPAPAPVVGVEDVVEELGRSQRPLLLLGSGARGLRPEALVDLARGLGAGVVCTASGRGAFPEDHPAFLGLSGLYLLPEAAEHVRRADTVLVLGSRLEETALEGMPVTAPTRWLQVNLAADHLVRRLPGTCAVADVAQLAARRPVSAAGAAWADDLARTRLALFAAMHRDVESRSAQVLAHLTEALPDGTVTVHENGLHDIWSYSFPHLQLPPGGRAVVLSEQTTLGAGVAAAAGLAATGSAPLVSCFTGDTALSTLLPELHDVLDRPGRLLYVVFDDGGMGWLDRAARSAGVSERFVGPSRLLGRLGPEQVIVPEGPETLGRDVVEAVDRAMAGRPTLLWVPVAAEDVAPQLRAGGHA